MISKEERNAIGQCKLLLAGDIYLHILDDDGGTAYTGTVNKEYNKDLETVLNLVEKQNKMIELMAEQFEIMKDKEEEIDCFIPREYSDIDDCVKKDSCQECIIEYFRNKAKESE